MQNFNTLFSSAQNSINISQVFSSDNIIIQFMHFIITFLKFSKFNDIWMQNFGRTLPV